MVLLVLADQRSAGCLGRAHGELGSQAPVNGRIVRRSFTAAYVERVRAYHRDKEAFATGGIAGRALDFDALLNLDSFIASSPRRSPNWRKGRPSCVRS